MLSKSELVALIREEQRRIESLQVGTFIPESKDCLFATLAAMRILRKHYYDAHFQAGTMSWPMVTSDKDDGKSPTHFSYVWSPESPASKIARILGGMPEIHCWVAIPQKELIIIDTQTKYFRQNAEEIGFVWQAPDPPDFLWCEVNKIPDSTIYHAYERAIKFAYHAIHCLLKGGRV